MGDFFLILKLKLIFVDFSQHHGRGRIESPTPKIRARASFGLLGWLVRRRKDFAFQRIESIGLGICDSKFWSMRSWFECQGWKVGWSDGTIAKWVQSCSLASLLFSQVIEKSPPLTVFFNKLFFTKFPIFTIFTIMLKRDILVFEWFFLLLNEKCVKYTLLQKSIFCSKIWQQVKFLKSNSRFWGIKNQQKTLIRVTQFLQIRVDFRTKIGLLT